MIKYSTNIWWAVSTEPKPIATVNIGDLLFWKDTNQEFVYQNTNYWVEVIKINNITGGTYNNITNSLTLQEYLGRNVTITGFTGGGGGSVFSGGTVTGPTIFLNGLSANTISATTYQNLPINTFITGGTFNSGTNTLNLVNYTGGTVPITGFTSGSGGTSNLQYYITGSTPSGTIRSGDRWFDTSSGYELVYINDGNSSQWVQPNNNGQITINNVTGGTSSGSTTSGNYLPLSGGTVTGGTIFTAGLSANTISATTYQNLPGTSFTNCITTLFVTNISGCSPVNIVSPLNVTNGLSITGNTVFGGNLTANTVSAATYYNLPIDVTVTGGTYSSGTATFRNNTGGTFTVTGFYTGNGITQGITGVTGNNGLSANTTNNVTTIGFSGGTIPNSTNFTGGLSANTISATTYQNLPTDIRVTGGTYTSGTATFTNNTGGTFTVTGFYTGNSITQGITGVTGNNGLSATTSGNITTIGFSGGTIPNPTNFTGGLSANTISATTYQNLPVDIRTTGATYSNNTFTFTNNTGGTYSVLFNTVTGITSSNGFYSTSAFTGTFTDGIVMDYVTGNGRISVGTGDTITFYNGGVATTSLMTISTGGTVSANSISATTYQNLPTDVRTTGATYSNNTFTYTNNTGGTYSVLFNTITGLTVNGNLTVTGNTISNTFSGVTDTISGTKGSVTTNGNTTTAFINVSGSNTVGGTGYTDFIRVTNTVVGATNATKTIRVNNIGTIEFLDSAYNNVRLAISDVGAVGFGLSTTSSSDATSNYFFFNNNNSQIYDDGNMHIHSRGAAQSMWINANNGAIILGNQSPVAGGGAASSIIMGSGSTTTRAYLNVYGSKTYSIGSYGYLATGGAGTGGSTTGTFGIYCSNRMEASEFDATSDERLKNIQGEIELDDAIKLVNTLKPIKFTWKNKESEGVKAGYSAQQVVKSGFNHLVSHIPNEDLIETTDDEGFTSPEGFQLTMGYDQVTPYHGVVIKNLLERVEELERQIKELKNSK